LSRRARVLREQLRDRELAQVDVQRLVPQKFGAGHDPRVGRVRLRVHQLGEEIRNRHSKRGRDALPRRPEVPHGLAALQVAEVHGLPRMLE